MAAEYMHIGIPVLNKKEGMTYNEDMKFWVLSLIHISEPTRH